MKLAIGKTSEQKFALTESDLATHVHMMGSTGGGKSWLLMYLAWQIMINASRPSLFVLDPHGDLFRKLVRFCARISSENPSFAQRVVIIDPSVETYPLRFNPFATAGHPAFTAALGLEACDKAWKDMNLMEKPRIARWLFNALFAVSELGLSLKDAYTILNPMEKTERAQILARMAPSFIKSDLVRFHTKKPNAQEELVEGPLNRLSLFFADPRLARMFSSTTDTLKVGELMASGSIVLVNLEPYRSHFSVEQVTMVGTLLVNAIVQAAFSRPEHERKPCYLMIDEFSRFTTRDIPYILEGGRKYNLRLILAHQQLEQLIREDERVYASVMANAKTKVVFGDLPMDDTMILAREFGRFDPYYIKDEIFRTYFHPHEESRTVTSRTEGSSSARSFGEHISQGAMYEPGGVFFDGDTLNTSTGSGSGHNISSGQSEAISEAVVPFYRLEERKEISSRTYMSIDEQQYLAAWALKNMPPQHCAVRTPRGEMKHVTVQGLKDPFASRPATTKLLKTVFTSHHFYDIVKKKVIVLPQPEAVSVAVEDDDPYFTG